MPSSPPPTDFELSCFFRLISQTLLPSPYLCFTSFSDGPLGLVERKFSLTFASAFDLVKEAGEPTPPYTLQAPENVPNLVSLANFVPPQVSCPLVSIPLMKLHSPPPQFTFDTQASREGMGEVGFLKSSSIMGLFPSAPVLAPPPPTHAPSHHHTLRTHTCLFCSFHARNDPL